MSKIDIPHFGTKAEKIDWLVANKTIIIAAKKSQLKEADIVSHYNISDTDTTANKSENEEANGTDIVRKLIINTTNVIDSHEDCHIPGIWKKALKEGQPFYLLQEHRMSFDKVITQDVKAYTKNYPWSEVGGDFEGNTEALVFEAVIGDRNPFMKEQYIKGYVKNHSVGMMYVKIFMCIDDDRYPEYKSNWDLYYPMVANKKKADELGYFYAVTEAKIIEGSAVIKGSNPYTPTKNIPIEPSTDTPTDEPSTDTPEPNRQEMPAVKFINFNLY